MDRKLLEILCCPVTRIPVRLLSPAKLKRLNQRIEAGEVRYADGSPVEAPLEEALVTENGTTIYRVDDGIPVMLEERGIPVSQLDEF